MYVLCVYMYICVYISMCVLGCVQQRFESNRAIQNR